jgi:uncharacterized membrane protein (DUF485 family)
MLHEPVTTSGKDLAIGYKTRIGAWMFLLYALVYAGFVAINLISPKLMETIVVAGLNLAVFYGFLLIVFALFLALIYNHLCTTEEKSMLDSEGKDK